MATAPVHVYSNDGLRQKDDVLIELPLEIWVRQTLATGKVSNALIATTLRTPGNDSYLSAGFLLAECIIQFQTQILGIQQSAADKIIVDLRPDVLIDEKHHSRLSRVTSSCGYCGRNNLAGLASQKVQTSNLRVSGNILQSLPRKMAAHQNLFQKTGGAHAAALFSASGECHQLFEDIGRHNAIDKLVGWALEQGLLPLSNLIIMTSGRLSYEIVHKVISAGGCFVAAVGAPSSMAVELAGKHDATLAGFVSSTRFNLYSARYRVYGEEKSMGRRVQRCEVSPQDDPSIVGNAGASVTSSSQSEVGI